MIREATPADALRLTDMARHFHAAAGVPAPWVSAYAHARFVAMIAATDATVIVWDDGAVRGAIAGALVPQVWHPVTYATELGWWLDPAARGRAWRPMLRAFEAWAASRDADGVVMSALEDRAATLIARAGYEPQGERHLLKVLA